MSEDNFEYRPLSELPDEADPTSDRPAKYSFGSDVFGASSDWIIAENNTSPVRLYRLPAPVSRILDYLTKVRFDMGRADAQEQMRRALGLE